MVQTKPFLDFSEYLKQMFPGVKVQKISINAGFTCPNRDGSKGVGGCTYCNNSSFSPGYSTQKGSVTSQLREGIDFFSYKYPEMKYLAYFQSYTSTYGGLEELMALYREALEVPDVIGLVIGTRPDCVSEELLDYLAELQKEAFVYLEYGVESTNNDTLNRIHRGHRYQDSVAAILKTSSRGLPMGVHLIIGLPQEEISDYLAHIDRLSALPITSIKLHQLQILKGTIMGKEYLENPESFKLFTAEEYVDIVCQLLAHMCPTLYVDRFVSQAPSDLLLAPKWGIKNYIFTHRVEKRMRELGLHQGVLYRS